MDMIFIHALPVEVHIGASAWEQRIVQILQVDVELATDTIQAAERDDLALTIDYACVARRLQALGASGSWQLVETFAEAAAACLLDEFPTSRVHLRIVKRVALPKLIDVGVIIERTRQPT